MTRLLLLLSVAVSAQQVLDLPPLAHVLDGEGRLTAVYGLAGNFVPGAPGETLLAYANDGEYEWRLAAGELVVTHEGQTARRATEATRAEFRGAFAVLGEERETLRLEGGELVAAEAAPAALSLAGRTVVWADGQLRITQADGSEETAECPVEPEAMTAAAADWVRLTVGGRPHLLRVTPGRVALYVLPKRVAVPVDRRRP